MGGAGGAQDGLQPSLGENTDNARQRHNVHHCEPGNGGNPAVVQMDGLRNGTPISAAARSFVGQSVRTLSPVSGVHTGTVTAVNATVVFPEGTITGLDRSTLCPEAGLERMSRSAASPIGPILTVGSRCGLVPGP